MRKISLTSQLIVLFLSIILLSSCAFSVITLTRVRSIADEQVYSRLSTYVYLVNDEKIERLPNNLNIGFSIKKEGEIITYKSQTLSNYMDNFELSNLINELNESNEASENPKNAFAVQGYVTKNRSKIYYVVSTNNKLNDYTIIYTDAQFANSLVKNVSLQVIFVFFVLILISVFVIYFWSNGFVKRLKSIQYHVDNLPKSKYSDKYIDDGNDEIGDLSIAVENMRAQIEHNEGIKQEMLQNISHDFKTPIAVIKSYAEAIEDGMADENANKIIIAQADLLKKKVNRLLQYNSLEYLNHDEPFENINMKELILDVVENYKFLTDITIELDLDDNIYFKGYTENWHTVIDNILDNAKRYAKSKIKIVLKPSRIRIYNDGDHIDEKFLNSVFKPYEKGSRGEFGLGMSIVKKTVDFFGLNMKVANEDIGVSFIIEEPRK